MYRLFIFVAIVYCVTALEVKQDVSNRIINGDIAAENQFPYMISLQKLGTDQLLETRGHRCGGVLFTLQHALTAASCIHDVINGLYVVIEPSEYRVFAGSSSLTNDRSPNNIRNITNFIVHPEYLGLPSHFNDIAIITVTTPFSNDIVRPLALPSDTFEPNTFTRCTVAGWGASDVFATASAELRYADKYIYSQDLCTTMYNSLAGTLNILPTMVCATSLNIISTGCTGDYGNPLVCNNTLTGVLFMTDMCRSSAYPEVYTRVPHYTAWIRSVSSAQAIFSPGFILFLTAAVSTLLLQ